MGPNLPQTVCLVLALSPALCAAEVQPQQPSARTTSSPHGHMPLDPSQLDRWERERAQAPVPTVALAPTTGKASKYLDAQMADQPMLLGVGTLTAQ